MFDQAGEDRRVSEQGPQGGRAEVPRRGRHGQRAQDEQQGDRSVH